MKHGIEEINDVLVFADLLVLALERSGGKINQEVILDAIKDNNKELLDALWGLWQIPDEMSDLDAKERAKLVDTALPILFRLVRLFLSVPR